MCAGPNRSSWRHRPKAPISRDSWRHAEEVRGSAEESQSAGVLAHPTGVDARITTYNMPIEGKGEWLAAATRPLA